MPHGARQVDIHVGTLSKAFGALGGFAACTASLKSYLLNKWVCLKLVGTGLCGW